MIATIENMERCKGVRGVFMVDSLGNEWTADPSNYPMHTGLGPLLDENDEPMVLVRRISKLVEPFEDEDAGDCEQGELLAIKKRWEAMEPLR